MKITFDKIFPVAISLFLFVFCVFPKLTGLSIGILLLTVVGGALRQKLTFKWSLGATLFVLFYVIYLVGTFWTNHWDIASKYLEYKLSLLIFPILLSFRPKKPLNFASIALVWVVSVIIASLLGIVQAIDCYQNGGGNLCFKTSFVSPIHHPTYFSAFHLLAIAFAWWGAIFKKKWFRWWWVIAFTVFSLGLHGAMQSLSGMLSLMLLFGGALLYFIHLRWGRVASVIALVGVPVLFGVVIKTVPQVRGEWEGATSFLTEYFDDPNQFVHSRAQPPTGSEQRLVMWTISVQGIAETPLGLGTGNVDAYLQERLLSINQEELAEKNLNPHNQYLQTGLEIGLVGLFVFLLLLGYFIYYSLKKRNYLLLIVVGSLAFNCLFESMLQRQSGIVFYTFWTLFLIGITKLEKTDEGL